jgi:hypothetical protein
MVKKHGGSEVDDLIGLTLHMTFNSVNKWFKKYNPDRLIFAFEGMNNWRKAYSVNETRRGVLYKGNRVKDPTMEHFGEVVSSFKDICEAHTSIVCLSQEGCEADDMIAGYIQRHEADYEDHEIVIISGDKDFIQLLRRPNTFLVNSDDGKLRNQPSSKIYYEDVNYFLFEKCIRGDTGDNVHSAYPRVRSTRLEQAYKDDFARLSLMDEKWSGVYNGESMELRVGDLFEENRVLMDLWAQPEHVRRAIDEGLTRCLASHGKYSNFHFMRFLGKYKLKSITDSIMKYTDMLACNQLPDAVRYQPNIHQTQPVDDLLVY